MTTEDLHELAEATRTANPVPDVAGVASSEEAAALRLQVRQRRHAKKSMQKPTVPKPLFEPPTRHVRPWAVAGVAFVLVLAAIGGAALMLRSDEPDVAGTLAPEPPVTAAPSALLEGTWERIVVEPGFHTEDLKLTSFGLVAAAVHKGVMISEDGGVTWYQAFAGPYEPFTGTTTTPAPPLTAAPPDPDVATLIRRVAEFDGALYAFGAFRDARTETSGKAVWRSTDAANWEKIVLDDSRTNFTIADILVTDEAILAYGEYQIDFGDPFIARSENGIDWTLHGPEDTGLERGSLLVAIEHSGRYLAIGPGEPIAGEVLYEAVYESFDGISWSLVPGSQLPTGIEAGGALVEHQGVLYAGGYELTPEYDPVAALWQSADGLTWDKAELDPNLGRSHVVDIVPVGDELLVVAPEEGPQPRVVLFAGDADNGFTRIADPEGILQTAEISSWRNTVVEGDHIVILGNKYLTEPSDAEPPAYVWRWTP